MILRPRVGGSGARLTRKLAEAIDGLAAGAAAAGAAMLSLVAQPVVARAAIPAALVVARKLRRETFPPVSGFLSSDMICIAPP